MNRTKIEANAKTETSTTKTTTLTFTTSITFTILSFLTFLISPFQSHAHAQTYCSNPPAVKNTFTIRAFVAGTSQEPKPGGGFQTVGITLSDGFCDELIPPNFLTVDCRNAAPRSYYNGTTWTTINHCLVVEGGDCVEVSGWLEGSFNPTRHATSMAVLPDLYCQVEAP